MEIAFHPAEDWDAVLSQFSDASVYQTLAFARSCWEGARIEHMVVRDAGKIIAAAQVRIQAVPVIGSGIAYVRWGPLFRRHDEPLDLRAFGHALRELRNEYVNRRRLALRLVPHVYATDPWGTEADSMLRAAGFRASTQRPPYRTMRVDVRAPIETLRKSLHSRWRNKLRNGEKADLDVSSDTSEEAYARFLQAYGEMMSRKRFQTSVDVHELARLQALLSPEQRMRIFFCEKDGLLCNALVLALGGDTGIYLLAATSDVGLKGNGAFLLQWKAMEWLHQNAYHWYDLGGIDPVQNPGVFQFKNGLGGVDTLQLSEFDSTGPWLSSFLVGAGERLKRILHR